MYRIAKKEKIEVEKLGQYAPRYVIKKKEVYVIQWKLEDEGYWNDHPHAPEFPNPEIAMEWWMASQKLKPTEEVIKLTP